MAGPPLGGPRDVQMIEFAAKQYSGDPGMNSFGTTKFSEEFLALCGMGLGLVVILGGIIIALAVVIAVYRRRTMLDEMEATLKVEMIQRGMSADEIERVLKAKMSRSDPRAVVQQFRGLPGRSPAARPEAAQP